MSNIKMIVTDLDNTLLNDEKKISDYTLSIIQTCMRKNIKFVPATARPLRKLVDLNILNQFPYDALICFNGSKIYIEDELIYHKGINKLELDCFLPLLIKKIPSLEISIEIDNTMYVNYPIWEVDPIEKNYIISNFDDLPDKICERIIIATENNEDINKIREILPDFLYMHSVNDAPIHRILHKDVSKANAINFLCSLWNISPSEIVAFGDDWNDLEMFQFCGHSVAMDNAIQEIKANAGEITNDNNNDGVAFWLENILLS